VPYCRPGYGRFRRGGAHNESVPDAAQPAAKKKSPVYRIGGVVLGVALGIVTYVLWRRGLDKGSYQDVLLSHHGPVR
jgi:hypothetical protein